MTDRLLAIAQRLDRLTGVATAALVQAVIRDGVCITAWTQGKPPALTGDEAADRKLTAHFCAGCVRQTECLELDLRWSGPDQRGTFGPLLAGDRRALYPLWRNRRAAGGGRR